LRLEVSMPREVRLDVLGADTASAGARRVVSADGTIDVPVVPGLGQAGAPGVDGPAFLEAPDTTIFVPAGWSARFTEHGYGVLTDERGASR
jgi:N-methylhydantoinase A/oxoprolinase/acetone carboxylase beta subunit